MRKWLLRGLVFAALMVVIRLLQGALINLFEEMAPVISVVLVLVYVIAALVWGLRDGRADARAHDDPDRRGDLAMRWLLAGIFAGVVSGFVAWIIRLFYVAIYAEGLFNEVTVFAAFTALTTFLFAVIGVAVGRYLIDRNPPPRPRRSGEDGSDDDAEERADTDVFAAVSHGQGEQGDAEDGASKHGASGHDPAGHGGDESQSAR